MSFPALAYLVPSRLVLEDLVLTAYDWVSPVAATLVAIFSAAELL